MFGNVMYCKIVIVLEWNFNLNTRETSEKVALSVLSILLSLLLQPSHSTPSATAFDSSSHRIRLLQPSQSSPSAIAVVSFSHRSRLLQPSQSSHSANSAVCGNSMKWMKSWNEVDKLVKWSGWTRIMMFMISAQLSILWNGKAKRSLLLLFPILLPSSVKFLAK